MRTNIRYEGKTTGHAFQHFRASKRDSALVTDPRVILRSSIAQWCDTVRRIYLDRWNTRNFSKLNLEYSKKLSAIVGYNLKIFLIVFLSFYSYIIIILFSSISFKKKSKVSNFEMFRRLHGFYLWMKLRIITPCCIMRIRNKCRRTIIYEE